MTDKINRLNLQQEIILTFDSLQQHQRHHRTFYCVGPKLLAGSAPVPDGKEFRIFVSMAV